MIEKKEGIVLTLRNGGQKIHEITVADKSNTVLAFPKNSNDIDKAWKMLELMRETKVKLDGILNDDS